jgi:hypothetical protein
MVKLIVYGEAAPDFEKKVGVSKFFYLIVC